jgi:hypothetical protein
LHLNYQTLFIEECYFSWIYFMLHQYQGLTIKTEPLDSRKSCGIGRFAHVWAANTAPEDLARLCCKDKARILRAFTGDLRYYEGDKGEFSSLERVLELLKK